MGTLHHQPDIKPMEISRFFFGVIPIFQGLKSKMFQIKTKTRIQISQRKFPSMGHLYHGYVTNNQRVNFPLYFHMEISQW
jgi:hypothetical protein